MISAKLRGLQALAPLTLDGSILHHLSQSSWQPPADPAVNNKKGPRDHLPKCESFKIGNTHPISTLGPQLQLVVWSNKFPVLNHQNNTASKSVQTDSPSKNQNCLTALSDKLADAFHKLNAWECNRLSDQPKSSLPKKCPTIWFTLGELGYSPALFNLGVWYELQALSCSSANPNERTEYQSKAEEKYKRAVLVDNHPVAAYNLACLLVRTDRKEVRIGEKKRSVTQLMQIAASSGIESAQGFIQG
ncbi:hypothetical protein D915_008751 [Fasciola hepatica]|uniref:Tetratricopeptide repeat protein n=1 Tax=Fasciola hepatica TaxID=6192 RepID=A0A4E0R2A9_FASHE|nr:hypothetical protein D915_008751 [Fasciola hepatica]